MLVLVINLERRPDRLAFMRDQLGDLAVPFERVAAIDGLAEDCGPITPTFSGVERACAMSHRRAWQRFLESREDHCLILEDDVILAPGLRAFLADPSGMPADADILRLETQFVRTRLGPSRGRVIHRHKVHRVHSVHTGCAAYVVSRRFATRAVRDLETFDAPLDYLLFDPHWPDFYANVFYQVRPALCVQVNLYEPTRGAAIGASNLQPAREIRFHSAVAVKIKPKRSLAVKCGREVGRWVRRSRAFLADAREFAARPGFWRDIPFTGALLPSAQAILAGAPPASHSPPDRATDGRPPAAVGGTARRADSPAVP